MLLPLQALGLTAVAAWLDRVEDLGPLPPVVAAAVAKPPLTLETGLLELATVAEGLARRLWPEWNRFSRDEVGRAQAGVDEPDEVDRARQSALAAVAEHGETMSAAVKGALEHLHEPSYPQRLEKLAQYAGDAVPGVLGRLTEQGRPSRWKEAVVGAVSTLLTESTKDGSTRPASIGTSRSTTHCDGYLPACCCSRPD